jgi:methionyl-tRNA synthetase
MLKSGGVAIPKSVWVHGFVAGPDGRKMSKSLGNVVNPHDMLDLVPADTMRWYLVRTAGFGDDLPFSVPAMKMMHNSDLCDCLGNLVNRAVKLTGGKLPDADVAGPFPFDVDALRKEVTAAVDATLLMAAAEKVNLAAQATNKWIADLEPWKMKKPEEQTRRLQILRVLAEAVFVLAHFYAPFIPIAAEAIVKKFQAPTTTLPKLNGFKNLPAGCTIESNSVLFEPFADAVQEAVAAAAKPAAKEKAAPAPKAAPLDASQPLFSRLEVRVGQIEEVWEHPEADRLFVEKINIGTEVRTIVSGLRGHYTKEQLMKRKILVVCNMKPKKMKGVESAGMVLCAKTADGSTTVEFVDPPASAAVGSRITLPGEEKWQPLDANAANKHKVWEEIAPNLKTNANRVVCYGGKPIVDPSGKTIVAPTLANLNVS